MMTFDPSYSRNGTEAWGAACDRLIDGAWHSRIELIEAMLNVGEFSHARAVDFLSAASRAGLLERTPAATPKRPKIKALRFRATDRLLRSIQDADSSDRSVVKA